MNCSDAAIGFLIIIIGVVSVVGGVGLYYTIKLPGHHSCSFKLPMPPAKGKQP